MDLLHLSTGTIVTPAALNDQMDCDIAPSGAQSVVDRLRAGDHAASHDAALKIHLLQSGLVLVSDYDEDHVTATLKKMRSPTRKADERVATSVAIHVIGDAEPTADGRHGDEEDASDNALQLWVDIESWREALPVASDPQVPASVTSISDNLSIVTVEQTFRIPPEFTSEQRIKRLYTLRRRNQGLVKDAEFDFQIRREEMKVAQQRGPGADA